jgi:hypothetical protein
MEKKMSDSPNPETVLAKELERWFDSAREIARDWIDFENEATGILYIIRQHEAEHTPTDKTPNRTMGVSDSNDARESGSLREGVPETLIDYLYQALKLRYDEKDRAAAEFIAKNIPVTQREISAIDEKENCPAYVPGRSALP